MKKLLFLIIIAIVCIAAKAQSIDERLGSAMNSSDHFGLYDAYYGAPRDSISPFMEIFSRCMIGNRFNRPDISIPAFNRLIKRHSGDLGPELRLQCAVMYSMDLSRVGRNKEACKVLSSALASAGNKVDRADLVAYKNMAEQYRALAKFSPYSISWDGERGVIPFDTVPAGKPESRQYLMQLTEAQVNGRQARITFDTGAGANVITDSLAKIYGLELLDAHVSATGVETSHGHYAIAKELKMGNITVRDVPFYVIDISSHNEKADQYLNALGLVVGSELMLQLKDVVIDFTTKEIQVPNTTALPSNERPNMCFSSGMNLLASAKVNGQPIQIVLDSGNAGYGNLNKAFFEANRDFLTSSCQTDTVNMAGVGGVWSILCYKLQDAGLDIGGSTIKIPYVSVQSKQQDEGYMAENNLGLKSMMLFRKVRFNLVDMAFSAER